MMKLEVSLVDFFMISDDETGSQSSLEGQGPLPWNQETTPKRTLSSVLSRLGNILERRSTVSQTYLPLDKNNKTNNIY